MENSELDEYLETYYEIVSGFHSSVNSKVLEEIENTKGRGGMYEYAKQLTDEFHEKYKHFIWDGEYFDFIESFLDSKL